MRSFSPSSIVAAVAVLSAGFAGSAKADLVITYTTDPYSAGFVGDSGGNTGYDLVGLSGHTDTLTLVPGVAQSGYINLISFTVGYTGSVNGPFDYTSAQGLTINGVSHTIAQPYTDTVGTYVYVLQLFDSPVLTFDLGSGNIVTFHALGTDQISTDGATATGDAYGEFELTTVSVPLPPAAVAGLGSLAGVMGLGVLRRRKLASR